MKPTPISYFCGISVFTSPPVTGSTVGSATTAVSVTGAIVESVVSVVSVAADPEPHAVSVSATPRAKINVNFFIYSKYTKV